MAPTKQKGLKFLWSSAPSTALPSFPSLPCDHPHFTQPPTIHPLTIHTHSLYSDTYLVPLRTSFVTVPHTSPPSLLASPVLTFRFLSSSQSAHGVGLSHCNEFSIVSHRHRLRLRDLLVFQHSSRPRPEALGSKLKHMSTNSAVCNEWLHDGE